MSYLPTTAAVAMKFVELGKDPDAEPSEYSKVISSDSSLSTKMLSLANSSWFGVRNKVTKVQVAVNLLGLSTVRTLAISYCVTGLHNELRLTTDESRMFWAASLCKAVAAKQYAALHDAKQAEEAFAAGLFQDFALPVMFAVAKEQLTPVLQDVSLDWKARLVKERGLFRLDHAELARCVAQKLELPDLFVDSVAFHHNYASLKEFIAKPVIADAVYLASLFPHVLDQWNRQDAGEMRDFLAAHRGENTVSVEQFLESVQKEFNQLFCYFEQGDPPETRLTELLEQATKEVADNTTRLMGTVHEMLQQAASDGKAVHQLLQQQSQLEQAASHDPLTAALNRDGFTARANELLAKACRYGASFAVVYLDIDNFKTLNDASGHARGDQALKMVVEQVQQGIRQNDAVGRMGGDEFVVVLTDCSADDAVQALQRVLDSVAERSAKELNCKVTLSAGVVLVRTQGQTLPLDKLLAAADGLMYNAKRAGGNQIVHRAIDITQKNAA
jgi:diguanylate cyclase (GGDEF)-like protein